LAILAAPEKRCPYGIALFISPVVCLLSSALYSIRRPTTSPEGGKMDSGVRGEEDEEIRG
jgi:hypothetical protein